MRLTALRALALAAAASWFQGEEAFPKTAKEALDRAAELNKRIDALESPSARRDLAALDEGRVLTALVDEYNRVAALLSREDELSRRKRELPQRRAAAEAALREQHRDPALDIPDAPSEADLAKVLGDVENRYAVFIDVQTRIDDLDKLAEGASFLERGAVRSSIDASERTHRDILMGRSALGPKAAAIEDQRVQLSVELGNRTLKYLDERETLAPESLAVARIELDAVRAEISRLNVKYDAMQSKFRENLTRQVEVADARQRDIAKRRAATRSRTDRALLELEEHTVGRTKAALEARMEAVAHGVDYKLSSFYLDVRARLRSLDDVLTSKFQKPSGVRLAELYRSLQRVRTSKTVKDLVDELPRLRFVEAKARARGSLERQRADSFEEDELLGRPDFVRLCAAEPEDARPALLTRYDAQAAAYLGEARSATYALYSLSDAASARAASIASLAENLDVAERNLRSRALFARVPTHFELDSLVRAGHDAVGVVRDLPEFSSTLVRNAAAFVKTPGNGLQVLLTAILLPAALGLVFFTKRVAKRIASSLPEGAKPSLVDRSRNLAAELAHRSAWVGFLALAASAGVRLFEASPALVRAVDAGAIAVFFAQVALALATAVLRPKEPRLRIVPLDDRAAKYAWRVALLAALSVLAVAVPRQVLDAIGYGGRNHEFLELLSRVQRGLVIASIVILFGRKSILDGIIPRGEHPAWRAVRSGIVRLRPMILAVALAILVLPHLGYPFLASFLESISIGGILIAAGGVFAHRAVMELWNRLAPNLTYGVKGSEIAEARRKLLDQVVHTLSFAFFTVAAYVAFVSILRVGEEDFVAVDIGVVAGRRLSVLDVLRCFAVLGASFVVANWTRRALDLFFLPLTRLDIGTRYAVALTSSYVVVVLGVVAACLQLGLQLGDFAILLGAAGFAIGLGLQQSAANFLSGLSILFTRPVKVGDVIESESRIGTVKMINIVSTVIVTPENHEIRIPNGDILGKRLVNQTGHDPKIRATCRVSVAYGTDIDKARAAIVEAVKHAPGVDPRPAPQVVVAGFGDSGITLDVWIWTGVGIREREDTTAAAQTAILAGLRGVGIEIPFPQLDLHVKEPGESRHRPRKE